MATLNLYGKSHHCAAAAGSAGCRSVRAPGCDQAGPRHGRRPGHRRDQALRIDPPATLGTNPISETPIPVNSAANAHISAHTVDDLMETTTAPGVPPA